MTITAEKAPEQQAEATNDVVLLSREQAYLAGRLLFGLVPQLDALISDLRTYGFNEHTPKNVHKLEWHSKGLKFEDSSNNQPQTTLEWQRVPRVRIPASGGDTRPSDWFPVTMQERHPSLLPPKVQLIIPNVTDETLEAMKAGTPSELKMAKIIDLEPRSTSPALVTLGGAVTAASCRIIQPFAGSTNATRETVNSQVYSYTSMLMGYLRKIVSLGTELNVVSAEPLAERFLK